MKTRIITVILTTTALLLASCSSSDPDLDSEVRVALNETTTTTTTPPPPTTAETTTTELPPTTTVVVPPTSTTSVPTTSIPAANKLTSTVAAVPVSECPDKPVEWYSPGALREDESRDEFHRGWQKTADAWSREGISYDDWIKLPPRTVNISAAVQSSFSAFQKNFAID